jgi:hypothetical protein
VSGEPEGFYGVELVSTSGNAALRVAVDPILGTRARLLRAGGESTTLEAKQCTLLNAAIQRTGTRINGVTLLAGKVTVDCTLDDGSNLAGEVKFQSCHRSARGTETVAGLGTAREEARLASVPLVPEYSVTPEIPANIRALRVHPRARVVGTTVGGESIDTAERACAQSSAAFLRKLGFAIDDANPDVEVEIACTGHVVFRHTGNNVEIIRPRTDAPSVTVRALGRVIDTVPAGPPIVRCEIEGTQEDRQKLCVERTERMTTARIAGLLGASRSLAAVAEVARSRR